MNKTNNIPGWISSLEEADIEFIRKFVVNSGSLKKVAKIYSVSYPTVRIKLDRLIEKIKSHDVDENEDFIKFIKTLLLDDRIHLDEAKLIIEKYKSEKEGYK